MVFFIELFIDTIFFPQWIVKVSFLDAIQHMVLVKVADYVSESSGLLP